MIYTNVAAVYVAAVYIVPLWYFVAAGTWFVLLELFGISFVHVVTAHRPAIAIHCSNSFDP